MRVIFAGTPIFAQRTLDALLGSDHEVVAVLTQPDRPAGRGNKTTDGPVKKSALQAQIPVYQPDHLKDCHELLAEFRMLRPDVLIVVAYGLLLPPEWLSVATFGALNVHASLLPRWRGAAPIQRALMAGDRETGICVMQMEQGLDTGPVLSRESCPILAHDTAGTLHDRLAPLGARLLLDSLIRLENRTVLAQPQALEGVTYAHKIQKSETWIDWRLGATELDRMIRALNPGIMARTLYQGQLIKIWSVERLAGAVPKQTQPGEIIRVSDNGVEIGCGDGLLRVTFLQRAGGKPLFVKAFHAGMALVPGHFFGGSHD